MVHTEHGDLILDPRFRNRLYLHGLELSSGSKSGKTFTYAYNLLDVKTGRDRDTVSNALTEAKKIAQIRRTALLDEKRTGRHSLLKRYHDLLTRKIRRSADIRSSYDTIAKDVVALIWLYMKSREDFSSKFYYNAAADPNVRPRYQNYMNLKLLTPPGWRNHKADSRSPACRSSQENVELTLKAQDV